MQVNDLYYDKGLFMSKIMAGFIMILCVVITTPDANALNNEINDTSRYTLELGYADTVIATAGSSEFVMFPSMVSIYFERMETIKCSIHIRVDETGVEIKQYNFGAKYSNGSGIVCTKDDDLSKERIASFEGVLEITEVNRDRISGSFEANLMGAISGAEYTLKGDFISVNKR